MKICFISGSLCPGEDGVGDYTRRMALQFSKDGHDCLLISLNDLADTEETGHGLSIIRRQGLLDHNERRRELLNRILAWQPEWISLQFVCFSFHRKGLIHKLIPFISEFPSNVKRHVMFHELWVGEQPSLPFKLKVLGALQRYLILKALKTWQPAAIHTSNSLYRAILAHHGYEASILPLYGNIPVSEPPHDLPERPAGRRVLIFPFSQRHDWNVAETMKCLESLAARTGLKFDFIQVGHLRSGAQHWDYIKEFCRQKDWSIEIHGRQDEASISALLHAADIGISSAHIALAGKSGAVAAMREHGLPVLCTATQPVTRRFNIRHPDATDGLYSLVDGEDRLLELFRSPNRLPVEAALPSAAGQMARDLTTLSDVQ